MSAGTGNNNTTIIIIVVVVLLLCCGCAILGVGGWFYGDAITDMLGLARLLPLVPAA